MEEQHKIRGIKVSREEALRFERIKELRQWLDDHYGEVIYGGWRGDEPNEAWKKLNEYKELTKKDA